jgi:hypothetical protein
VPSANEYRELADKCFRSARDAHTEDERMMYLTLAQTWLEEASRGVAAGSRSRAPGANAQTRPPGAGRRNRGKVRRPMPSTSRPKHTPSYAD